MFIAKPEQIKEGQTIWCATDERPFDGWSIDRGIVREIYIDHYLFDMVDDGISNVWGDYDTEECSVANFTTEDEAVAWIRRRER